MISHPRLQLEAEDLADPAAPVSEGILLSSSVDEVLVIDPMTGEEIGDIAASNGADLETALRRFHDYEQNGSWVGLSSQDRMSLMDRLVGIFENHGESIAELATLESGTPSQFSYQTHVAGPLAIMRATASLSSHSIENKSIAIIGYHQPLAFLAQTVIMALEQGRPSIIVASPLAPLTSIAFMNCLLEADLPKGVVHMVLGTPTVIESLLISAPDQIVDNSPGGADAGSVPIVIEPESQTDDSVSVICRNTLLGHSTVPGRRPGVPHLFVPVKDFDLYQMAMTEVINSLVVGDPWDAATEVGPIIRPVEGGGISSYLEGMKGLGARLIQTPESLDKNIFPVPTLVHNLSDPRVAMNNTICAPVAAVFTYEGEISI